MGYTLTITVGGLCMLVQREKAGEEGLYILMPETKHGHMQHCPVMITQPGQVGADNLLVPLMADEDLTGLTEHGASAAEPKRVLEISKYGAAEVDPTVFTGHPPKTLARLIRLPLGSTMADVGDTASLQVPDGSTYVTRDFVGTVVVTVKVTKTNELKIAGKTLAPSKPAKPGDPTTIEISIIHAPREEWECKKRAVTKNHAAMHVAAYFDLLSAGAKKPEIKFGKTDGGEPGHPTGKPCPTKDEPAPSKCGTNLLWIDPANCTVGIGDG